MAVARAGLHGTLAQSTSPTIGGSLLFNSYQENYLNRSLSATGNRRRWTMSTWMRITPSNLSNINHRCWFGADAGSSAVATRFLTFVGDASDQLQLDTTTSIRDSNSRWRDPTGWYHHVVKLDTTKSDARDQLAWYINGEIVTTWGSESSITQNTQMGWMNSSSTHLIGANQAAGPGQYFGGQMSEVHCIDSAALAPTYFGYTDPLTGVWRPKTVDIDGPNKGLSWSGMCSGSTDTGNEASKAFDGSDATSCYPSPGSTVTMTIPAGKLKYTTSFEAWVSRDANGGVITVNGGSDVNVGSSGFQVVDLSGQVSAGANITEITWARAGSGSIGLYMIYIMIDGMPLIDNDWSNYGGQGFYLPLDGNTPVGQDKSGRGNDWAPKFGRFGTVGLGKAYDDPGVTVGITTISSVGALPILNTVSGGGIAAAGVRTDAFSPWIQFAAPLVGSGTSDLSNLVNSGTSSKYITDTGSDQDTVTETPFYRECRDFVSSNSDDLTFTISGGLGSGDFTIEYWINQDTLSDYQTHLSSTRGTTGFNVGTDGSGDFVWADDQGGGIGRRIEVVGAIKTGIWYHWAFVRASNVITGYLNGTPVATYGTAINYSDSTFCIGALDSASEWTNGKFADVRIYVGVAKYRAPFSVASASPDVRPDCPSGASLGVSLKEPITGSTSWKNGGSPQIVVPYTDAAFDWTSSSTDFCVESWNYHTELVSGGSGVWAHGTSSGFQAKLDVIQHSGYPGYCWNFEMLSAVRIRSDVPVTLNKWTHVACVMRSGTGYLYVDGVQQAITGGHDIGAADTFYIGRQVHDGGQYRWNGLISNFRVVTGSAVYTGNFTPPTAPLENITNTKLLCCKDPTSVTNTEVTTGNLTASGSLLGASGFNPFDNDITTVLGSPNLYPIFNPLVKPQAGSLNGATYRDGFLYIEGDGDNGYYDQCACCTQLLPARGKYVFEYECLNTGGTGSPGRRDCIGVYDTNKQQDYLTNIANSVGYQSWDGDAVTSESDVQTGIGAYSSGQVASCAIDCNTGKVWFAREGVWKGDPVKGTGEATTLTNEGNNLVFCESSVHNSSSGGYDSKGYANFGQKPFKFPPPEGFAPLCIQNAEPPGDTRPDKCSGAVLWTGGGQSGSEGDVLKVVETGFQPDLVLCKDLDSGSGDNHNPSLYDSVRGTGARLLTNSTNAEVNSTTATSGGGIGAMVQNGFQLVNGTSDGDNVLHSGSDYCAWAWKAGGFGSGAFNVDGQSFSTQALAGITGGTISLTGCSVGTKQGLSIIQFSGTGSNATVPHGLTKAPDMIWGHVRNDSGLDWIVWWRALGSPSTNASFPSTNDFLTGETTTFNNTDPTDTLLSLGSRGSANDSGKNMIYYLWHDVPGLQKFGRYYGNGNDNGVFVYTGFQPAMVLIKCDSADSTNWAVNDNKRNPTNGQYGRDNSYYLNSDTAATTSSSLNVGFYSNGFKLRSNSASYNDASRTYVYAAWAEQTQHNLYAAQSLSC